MNLEAFPSTNTLDNSAIEESTQSRRVISTLQKQLSDAFIKMTELAEMGISPAIMVGWVYTMWAEFMARMFNRHMLTTLENMERTPLVRDINVLVHPWELQTIILTNSWKLKMQTFQRNICVNLAEILKSHNSKLFRTVIAILTVSKEKQGSRRRQMISSNHVKYKAFSINSTINSRNKKSTFGNRRS